MSDRILAATRKGLFIVTRQSSGDWKVDSAHFVGDHVPMAVHDPRDGALYAGVHHEHFGDKMHRSRDGGATWDEVGTPTYPEKPADRPDDLCPMRQIPIPWTTKLIWELTVGGGDQPGRLWCGTIPGGLFKSDDAGDSWELVRSLWDDPARAKWMGGGFDFPGLHSVFVDPRNSKRVVTAVSCGGVWISEDDGASWKCEGTGIRADYAPPETAYDPQTQDVHRLAACRANPAVMWAQHHNGIFRTADGGANWTENESDDPPSRFGFAVAAHPHDDQTAWFVPAIKDEHRVPVAGRFVVTRTRDGGKSFDTLTDGLPGEHAYDLVFRHGLDVDTTGERLTTGSTTGSLWVSENAGDQWRCVTSHLPPIYTVRFA